MTPMSPYRAVGPYRALVWAAVLCAGLAAGARAQLPDFLSSPDFDPAGEYRKAVEKSLPLLQSSAKAFQEHVGSTCVSCHHDMLPSWAFVVARDHGFKTDAAQLAEIRVRTDKFVGPIKPVIVKAVADRDLDRRMGLSLGSSPTTTGYALIAMDVQGWPHDEFSEALAVFQMRRQNGDGHWCEDFARVPFEGSDFTATAVSLRGTQLFLPKEYAREMADRVAKARAWLSTAKAKTTEDRAFRLLGLKWAGAARAAIRRAAEDLADQQNDDFGWGQLPGRDSDAYATGLALVALHEGGGMAATDHVYKHGLAYLLGTQKPDGSWFVQKRAIPVQPMFDAGYPGGDSQYISFTGACWATMALAYAVPPSTTLKATASAR